MHFFSRQKLTSTYNIKTMLGLSLHLIIFIENPHLLKYTISFYKSKLYKFKTYTASKPLLVTNHDNLSGRFLYHFTAITIIF